MSRYSRQQEDRAEQKLRSVGFELVEDTGRRTTGAGDKIMRHPDVGMWLVIDNKSTKASESIRVKKADLRKIRKEAGDYGKGVGALTISFYNSEDMYIIFNIDDLEGVMY